MGSTKYIISMGELTRKDNSLCFRRDGKNVYIPVENTKEIFCFNEVSINTKLLDFHVTEQYNTFFITIIWVQWYILSRKTIAEAKLLVKQAKNTE